MQSIDCSPFRGAKVYFSLSVVQIFISPKKRQNFTSPERGGGPRSGGGVFMNIKLKNIVNLRFFNKFMNFLLTKGNL